MFTFQSNNLTYMYMYLFVLSIPYLKVDRPVHYYTNKNNEKLLNYEIINSFTRFSIFKTSIQP